MLAIKYDTLSFVHLAAKAKLSHFGNKEDRRDIEQLIYHGSDKSTFFFYIIISNLTTLSDNLNLMYVHINKKLLRVLLFFITTLLIRQ